MKSIDDKNDIKKMVMYIEYSGGVPVFDPEFNAGAVAVNCPASCIYKIDNIYYGNYWISHPKASIQAV